MLVGLGAVTLWFVGRACYEHLALRSALDEWRESGAPVALADLDLPPAGAGTPPLQLLLDLEDLADPEPSFLALVEGWPESLEGLGTGVISPGTRARVERVGDWYWHTPRPTFCGVPLQLDGDRLLDLALIPGLRASAGDLERDVLELALLDRRGALEALDALEPLARMDGMSALAESESRSGLPLPTIAGLHLEPVLEALEALELSAAVSILAGEDPTVHLDRLWSLAAPFEGVPLEVAFSYRRAAIGAFLDGLRLCRSELDPEQLESYADELATLDLARELKRVLLGERCRGNRVIRVLRGIGGADELIDADNREGRARRWVTGKPLAIYLGPRSQREFLEVAGWRLDALDREGLTAFRGLNEVALGMSAAGGPFAFAAAAVSGEVDVARSVMDTLELEGRRRLALCAVAWDLGGEEGLARALDQYLDPTTGERLERFEWTDPDGTREYVSSSGTSIVDGWPLE